MRFSSNFCPFQVQLLPFLIPAFYLCVREIILFWLNDNKCF
uniref:Uncharacterized protein n=1 Tax=Rhizophora mucronata TaxID=61149 RepID=A0A2P2ISW4_RHIMU